MWGGEVGSGEPPLDLPLHTDLDISHYNDMLVLFVRQGL